jgi:hypothetical protein
VHRLAAPLCALLLVSGCVHLREPTRKSVGTWIDEPLIAGSVTTDADRLTELAEGGWRGRVIRLDRLLDLYDAARFSGDESARETLWLALGGSSSTRGHEASREAVLRMLDEAYALDEAAQSLDEASASEDERRFVADAIALFSADLYLPDSAESLIDQTLGYRVLSETGHARIVDNAHLRLYDFVFGVLRGSLEFGPEQRYDVAVHALYSTIEDISSRFADGPPHSSEPLLGADELCALLDMQRTAAGERWASVLTAANPDAQSLMCATLGELLPRPRDPSWVLSELPRGTGEPESLAPIVLLQPGAMVLEPGGLDALTLAPASAEARDRIAGLLARDGRGTLLLAAAPELPAPEFAAGLAAMVGARVSTIEVAVHEPRTGDEPGMAVVALPLQVVHADELSPGARAIREARIHVRLSGRGVRFAIDDRWLVASPELPSDLRSLVARLHEGFPRERVIRLSLAGDVQPQQLVELMAAIIGGRNADFVAIGWAADQPVVALPDKLRDSADQTLAVRTMLAQPRGIAIENAAEVPEGERGVVDKLASEVGACVPELERAMPKGGLTITLGFADTKIVSVAARGKGVAKDRLAAVERCIDEHTVGRRLREHAEPLSVIVRFE